LHRPGPTLTEEELTQSYDGGRSSSSTEGLHVIHADFILSPPPPF
jgi:hypothetical protein